MPGWQKRFEPLWKSGKIQLVGIVQEQHADRARLYAQWRGIKWPILVDSLNLYGIKVVPIPMALDEAGCVVLKRIRGTEEFDKFLAAPRATPVKRAEYVCSRGVKRYLDGKLDSAAFDFAMSQDAEDLFRGGVVGQARADAGKLGGATSAVKSWQRALAKRPDQYIWRRRIQQYGPRLAKPYNFFGWVEQARREITARGETPVTLRVEPRGSELIDRASKAEQKHRNPDPDGKLDVDTEEYLKVETVVIPPVARPGAQVRIRFICVLRRATWNDEGEPLSITVNGKVTEADLVGGSGEMRLLECEVEVPADGSKVSAYAAFDICIKKTGVCCYLRQELKIPLKVDANATKIR
jgi:hypothetical protein